MKWPEISEMPELPAYAPIWKKTVIRRSYEGRNGQTDRDGFALSVPVRVPNSIPTASDRDGRALPHGERLAGPDFVGINSISVFAVSRKAPKHVKLNR
jgi:hypothetical protein